MSPRHVFVADVHLRSEETAKRDALVRLIDSLAGPETRLYLLGDVFDVWIGEVQLETEPGLVPVIEAMERFVRAGGKLTFFHGNRDFYMGRFLTRRAGAETVRRSKVVDLDGRRTWLAHGDLLHAPDQLHRFVRWLLRSPVLTGLFYALPRGMKYGTSRTYRDIAARVRPRPGKPKHDVDRVALRRLMRKGMDVAICGHAHVGVDRVVRHGGRELRLIVLPAWTDRGWMLEYSGGAFELKPVDYAG